MITNIFNGWSIKCENESCGVELEILDSIDGNITQDQIEFCPICGEEL